MQCKKALGCVWFRGYEYVKICALNYYVKIRSLGIHLSRPQPPRSLLPLPLSITILPAPTPVETLAIGGFVDGSHGGR